MFPLLLRPGLGGGKLDTGSLPEPAGAGKEEGLPSDGNGWPGVAYLVRVI